MRYQTLITAICFVSAASAQNNAAETAVHPHFRSARPAPVITDAGGPPFETPPSLACLYKLVPNPVPGCPVLGTSELPTGGQGIIAVVNAYDYPNAAHDLNVFSRQFGVPECNTANPCFKRVYSNGKPSRVDGLWAANAADVIEYAHAYAPKATIILIETPTGTIGDLLDGVRYANGIISMSPLGKGSVIMAFGAPESTSDTTFDMVFHTPGVIYISGNQGAPGFLEYPATSPYVLALGGTSVLRDDQGLFRAEIATSFWSGGPSEMESRPAFQDSIQNIVHTQRGVPDIGFCSDPIHGAQIFYDSIELDGFVGWQYTGNVGFAEAAWAAIISLAGNTAPDSQGELALLYSHMGDNTMRDIVFGQAFGVHATPGWDFLTGIGVGIGLSGK